MITPKLLSMTLKAFHDLFPSYCSSLGFLTAPHLAHHTSGTSQRELLTAPQTTKPFLTSGLLYIQFFLPKTPCLLQPFSVFTIQLKHHLLQEAPLTFSSFVLFHFLFLFVLLAPWGFPTLCERDIPVFMSVRLPSLWAAWGQGWCPIHLCTARASTIGSSVTGAGWREEW